MFGLFKKKAPDGSFIIVALKAALVLRATERDNGGIYTHPDVLRATVRGVAEEMNAELTGNIKQVTDACVMELLMEQNFIDRLLDRAMHEALGTLTAQDEKDLTRITAKITGIS